MRAAMRGHDDAGDIHRAPRPNARHEAFRIGRILRKARDGRRERLGYVDDHGAMANLLEALGKSNPFNGGSGAGRRSALCLKTEVAGNSDHFGI
jgi:hypothetical protein